MPEHAELSDAELALIETRIEGESRAGLYLAAHQLLDEVRRLRDVEHQKLQALVDDVIAHPEQHPEIVERAERYLGRPSDAHLPDDPSQMLLRAGERYQILMGIHPDA